MTIAQLHGYALFRVLVVAAFALSVATLLYAALSAPSRVASRLGVRGFKRRRAIENNASWAQIEPLVRWLSVRVSGVVSDGLRRQLDEQIAFAGDYLGLLPEEYVALTIVSAFGGLLFGVVAGLASDNVALLIIVCGSVGGVLPYVTISGEAQRRLKQINRRLPYGIDLIALAMSAGLDFPGAIRQVVEKSSDPDDALVGELRRVLQELQLGRTRVQVLSELAKRAPTPSVTEFVAALVQAEQRGNPVADALSIQATTSRQKRTVNAEEAAAKAGVAMIAPLVMLFLSILILLVGPMMLKLMKTL
jgi:tight adherence protein C